MFLTVSEEPSSLEPIGLVASRVVDRLRKTVMKGEERNISRIALLPVLPTVRPGEDGASVKASSDRKGRDQRGQLRSIQLR